MTDSVFSSPARSWRDVRSGSLPDSENESDGFDQYLSLELPSVPDSTIISGWMKFRDQKRWKLRWGVVTKLSPAAGMYFNFLLTNGKYVFVDMDGVSECQLIDCLHLQLYRDSRDRYKHGLTKASLSLQHFLGLETGFTLDKESNTIAVICQDLIVVLAFDTRERLIQWQVKIYSNLGEDQQFLIQISTCPPKTKLNPGPVRLHIQDHRFCLTTGIPPKLAGCWEIKHLRRYGVVDGRFCFEGGSLCGKGEGLYVFLTDQADEISRSIRLASEGRLDSRRRPLFRNMSVQHESPRKCLTLRTETRLSEISCADSCLQKQLPSQNNVPDNAPWPSMETQADVYGHGDTSSLSDFPIDSQNTRAPIWPAENQLERCSSCIGKLGLISRPSTAANTPGSINFNPWSINDTKLCLTGMHENVIDESDYSCDVSIVSMSQKSKCSNSSSSGTDCCSQKTCCQYPLENKLSTTTPSNFPLSSSSRITDSPPSRPPKPAKYRNHPDSLTNSPTTKKINKPPMPLPLLVNECSCKNVCPKHLENYEIPGLKNNAISDGKKQYYDTPRNMNPALREASMYGNYDVPPAAIPVKSKCSCIHSKLKIVMETKEHKCNMEPCCQQLLYCAQPWMQVPLQLKCKNQWQNICMFENTKTQHNFPIKESIPLYAKVDLSKKLRNRMHKESDKNKSKQPAQDSNYMNIQFKNEDENYKHMPNLNYMNLEFTNSLVYYENVKELLSRCKPIDSLNIEQPKICNKCGHATKKEVRTDYMPMLPLKIPEEDKIPEKKINKCCTLDYNKVDKQERKRRNSTGSPSDVKFLPDKLDSDSGLESDKLSQENDDTLENLKNHNVLLSSVRRLSNVVCKTGNRDSSSSNDSGFSSGSLKCHQDFTDFEMPLTTAGTAVRHHSFSQQAGAVNGPRRTKSSDPLRDLTFHFHKSVPPKSSSAEAELPLCLKQQERCSDCTSPAETIRSIPYVDCRSTSSGTSDMSDYIETLSISSHSSSDVHHGDIRLHQSAVPSLKPRSGVEYQKVDRISIIDSESAEAKTGPKNNTITNSVLE